MRDEISAPVHRFVERVRRGREAARRRNRFFMFRLSLALPVARPGGDLRTAR